MFEQGRKSSRSSGPLDLSVAAPLPEQPFFGPFPREMRVAPLDTHVERNSAQLAVNKQKCHPPPVTHLGGVVRTLSRPECIPKSRRLPYPTPCCESTSPSPHQISFFYGLPS
jgi:hypothetical protein